jgi:hypothetical protein
LTPATLVGLAGRPTTASAVFNATKVGSSMAEKSMATSGSSKAAKQIQVLDTLCEKECFMVIDPSIRL